MGTNLSALYILMRCFLSNLSDTTLNTSVYRLCQVEEIYYFSEADFAFTLSLLVSFYIDTKNSIHSYTCNKLQSFLINGE